MQRRGMKPKRATKPQCGTRKGSDIITANSNTSPQRSRTGPCGRVRACLFFISLRFFRTPDWNRPQIYGFYVIFVAQYSSAMVIIDILKAFLIGICASAPVGPIAILVIQKTLSKGHKAGFVTGLGACLVDTVFSIVAIFALAFAQKVIEDNKEIILLAGGLVVAILGWRMAVSNPFRKIKAETESTSISIKDFLQAIAMGFSNPGAILVIFALFAFFGMGNTSPHDWKVAPIIFSVSAGAAAYWFCVTALLNYFRKRFRLQTIMWINRIAGAIIVIIGLSLIGEGLFRVILLGKPLI